MKLLRGLKLTAIIVGVLIALPLNLSWAAEDLTGTWTADDGGIYYARQVGNDLWCVGLSDKGQGSRFTNIFKELIKDNLIVGEWVDVPRGNASQSGRLVLSIVRTPDRIELRKRSETGGFGGSVWKRIKIVSKVPERIPKGLEIKPVQPLPGVTSPSSDVAARSILPDGTVEIRYTDGRIKRIFKDGGDTMIFPDGRKEQKLYKSVSIVRVPTLPGDPELLIWLEAHNEGLLRIMRSLVSPQAAEEYLRYEGGERPLGEKINERTRILGQLLSP